MNSQSIAGANLPLGTKLHEGAFTIGKVLGQGGCGITYHGADVHLRRQVAIKEFFPPGSTRMGPQVLFVSDASSAREQFLEEARSLARFQHPNIVNVLTVFEENNTAYMVMEYLKGKNLEELVEEAGALAEKEAISCIAQMAKALAVVHQAGFIHRDIKPANAIRCDDGRVVLIDFGLNEKLEVARTYQTRQLTLTAPAGTEGYAPPEQYLKGSVQSIATDIYALGATLYFLLTGTVPVSAPERAMGAALRPPAEVNPRVSSGMSDGIVRAMALKDKERFQSVQELLRGLTGRAPAATPVQATPVKRTVTIPPVSTPAAPAVPVPVVPTQPQSPATTTTQCRQCGSMNPKMAAQCVGCGINVTAANQRLLVIDPASPYYYCFTIFLPFLVVFLLGFWLLAR